MNKSSFFIVGQHAVIEALRNPQRKVLRVFLTEEAKKNIHRKNQNKNLLEDIKVYFKSKKELDKYSSKEQLMHNGYVAEIEHLDHPDLKQFIKDKNNVKLGEAVQVALNQVIGAYAIAVINNDKPDEIDVATLGSPICIGSG